MTAINGSATSVEAKIQNEFPFFKALKKEKEKTFFTPPRSKGRVGEDEISSEAYS